MPGAIAKLFGGIVAWQIDRSLARIEHDFAYGEPQHDGHGRHRLATPVAVVDAVDHSDAAQRAAAVYLNPHFQEPALADGLEQGLADAGVPAHLVGEGYAHRPHWHARDEHWIEAAAHSAFIVSAPGMAALSIAAVYRKPILLLLTDQPEQAINAGRAAQLGLAHRVVVWRGDAPKFARAVAATAGELLALPASAADATAGRQGAIERLRHWTTLLYGLASTATR
jgi:hypothetical protein